MFCPKCGTMLDDDTKFCSKCGEKIIDKIKSDKPRKDDNSAVVDKLDINNLKRKASKFKYTILIIFILCLIVILLSYLLFLKSNHRTHKNIANSIKKEVTTKDDKSTDDEYIFPSSDTEYLSDEDVENISNDKLALARNEIIARHGRIYTDKKYKSYFESQSWYKGTVDPDEFDANFENELNDIEKANIELIKKYEQKATVTEGTSSIELENLTKEYYGDFLEYYKKEEQDGFVRKDLELINPIFADSLYFPDGYSQTGMSLYYTVFDLANDGVPELFISDGDSLYGAYGLFENEGQICPLIYTGTAYMGDRAKYYICENNMIKSEGSGGASSNIIAYYQVNPHSQNATCTEAIYQENANYYWGKLDGNNFEQSSPATADEYENLKNKYPLKNDIQWLKLSEFQMDPGENSTGITYNVTQSNILGSKYDVADFQMQATSTLQENGYPHDVKFLQDGDNSTCWSEGVAGYGIGEEILFKASNTQNINALFIKPGFTKSEKDFYKNGCPTKIKIKCGDIEGEADLSNFQYAEDSFLIVAFGKTFSVNECSITIEDVREGNKYEDTCITEIYFLDLP